MTIGSHWTVVGRQQRYSELPAAVAGIVCWAAIAVTEGAMTGLEYAWLLVAALPLGVWVLRMRLLVKDDYLLEFAVVGPWRHRVDLSSLESLNRKRTGGRGGLGVIVVRDSHGGRLQIPVGRLSGREVWGKMLLDAAAQTGASVDNSSRQLLERAVSARARGPA